MTRTFSQALRKDVSLLIAIGGPSGGGKTKSALRLARGLAGPKGKVLAGDTEAGRAKHYAPPPGLSEEQVVAGAARGDWHIFDYAEINPPFRPAAYLELIRDAAEQKYDVVVLDSWSHVWAGEGGMLDWHEEELQRMFKEAQAKAEKYRDRAPDEAYFRDKMNSGAWITPKIEYKAVMTRILQSKRMHVIFCLRAEEKLIIKQEIDEKGRKRTVYSSPIDRSPRDRWIPICCHNPEFMYEPTMSCVVTPDNPGVPIWIKLQEQHKGAFKEGQPLDEYAGAELARWASGEAPAQHKTEMKPAQGAAQSSEPAQRDWEKWGNAVTAALNKCPSKVALDDIVARAGPNLLGFKSWNAEKWADLMALIETARKKIEPADAAEGCP